MLLEEMLSSRPSAGKHLRKIYSMHIKDLMRLPAGHPPSPYNFPLPLQRDGKWGEGCLPDDFELFAVGWLGNSVPTRGKVHAECIDGLFAAYVSGRIFTDGTAGFHNCEFCSGITSGIQMGRLALSSNGVGSSCVSWGMAITSSGTLIGYTFRQRSCSITSSTMNTNRRMNSFWLLGKASSWYKRISIGLRTWRANHLLKRTGSTAVIGSKGV